MGKDDIQIGPVMIGIRKRSRLQQIIHRRPDVETWLNQDYTEHDIDKELRRLANNRAHGSDGIQGEAYNARSKRAIQPIMHIAYDIKTGRRISSF